MLGTAVSPPSPNGDFLIGVEQLASISRDPNFSALQEYGGASQLRICFPCYKFFGFDV